MTYQDKLEARRDRFKARAEKAHAEANQRRKASDDAVAGIPPGQPILVGHHSERRHRAALKRSDRNMRAALDADRKARYYEHRAASVGTAGISSDDEQAAEKIRRKIADLEAGTAHMKRVNAAWRKHGRPEAVGNAEAWEKIQAECADLPANWERLRVEMKNNFMNQPSKPRPPYEHYCLTGNSAERRRLQRRLEDLEKKAEAATRAGNEPEELYAGDGWQIIANYAENRFQILFDGKPDAETRQICKRQGFRWAPSQCAWQRHLNTAGRYAAAAVAERLRKDGEQP